MKMRLLFIFLGLLPAKAFSAEDCTRAVLQSVVPSAPMLDTVDAENYSFFDPDLSHGNLLPSYPHPFHFYSRVRKGKLELNLASEVGGIRSKRIFARKMFDDMMAHYANQKTEISIIEGVWTDGTNLNAFNDLIAKGYSAGRAARETWTGQQAARYGYTSVELTKKFPTPDGKKFQIIEVYFRKPEAVTPKTNFIRSFFQ